MIVYILYRHIHVVSIVKEIYFLATSPIICRS